MHSRLFSPAGFVRDESPVEHVLPVQHVDDLGAELQHGRTDRLRVRHAHVELIERREDVSAGIAEVVRRMKARIDVVAEVVVIRLPKTPRSSPHALPPRAE